MKLKTLKDFSDKECFCWFPLFYLKDECKKKRAIPEDLLKQEAIKWMKYDFENVCDFDTLTERWMKRLNLINQDVFCDEKDLK